VPVRGPGTASASEPDSVSPPGGGRPGLRLAALVTVGELRKLIQWQAAALPVTRRPGLASEVTVLTVTSARLFKSPLAVTQTRHAGGLCQWCQGQAAAGRQAAQIARDSELRLLSSMKMPRNLPCEAWQHSGRWHLGWNRPQRAGPRPGIGPPARPGDTAASFQDHDQVQVLVHELVTVGY